VWSGQPRERGGRKDKCGKDRSKETELDHSHGPATVGEVAHLAYPTMR